MEHKSLENIISEQTGIEQAQTRELLKAFSAILARECGELNRVAIPGFGSFEGVKIDEEVRTDLATGKQMLYPPMIDIRFNPGAMLKKKIN